MVNDPTGKRRRIALYLEAHGPTPGDRLAELFGMTPERFWPLIFCPWFEIEAGGWALTERGRREAMAEPAG
jgi:hypothetical protein